MNFNWIGWAATAALLFAVRAEWRHQRLLARRWRLARRPWPDLSDW